MATELSRRTSSVAIALLAILLAAIPAAADGNIAQGNRLALTYCARCHSIDKVTPSPFSPAPPFRTLHTRYPVEDLEEPLAEGIVTDHPSMPEFRFEQDKIA